MLEVYTFLEQADDIPCQKCVFIEVQTIVFICN